MGNVIQKNASAEDILRDVGITLKAAATRGSPLQDDAERFLRPSATLADSVEAQLAAQSDNVETLRTQQATENGKCNDLVAKDHDTLYNQIGRPGNDPLFSQMFPGGFRTYTSQTADDKPAALNLLARLIEGTTHPLIPPAMATTMAADLRAQAAALAAVNLALDPAKVDLRMTGVQHTSTAKSAQVQLSRLKKYWKGIGMTEVDVHTIIPDRPLKSARPAEVEVAPPEVDEGAAAETPAVVPPSAPETVVPAAPAATPNPAVDAPALAAK